MSSSASACRNRGCGLVARYFDADRLLEDRLGHLGRDSIDFAHGIGLGLGNAGLRLFQPPVEIGIELLALGFRLGAGRIAGVMANLVGPLARFGEFLFIGGLGLVGIRLGALGRFEIERDPIAAIL